MADLQQLYDAVLDGNQKAAIAVTQAALAENTDPLLLVTKYMVPAMDEVGRRFECEEYFVPELLLSARAMKGALELLRPLLVASGAQPAGRVAIGTVKGDLHDIGKNLVAMMLESVGYKVINLGIDLEPKVFVEQVQAGVQCIGMSALLTTTMPQMKLIIDSIEEAGLRSKVKIFVGGAPVTQEFANEIGADFYSIDAAHTIEQMNSVFG